MFCYNLLYFCSVWRWRLWPWAQFGSCLSFPFLWVEFTAKVRFIWWKLSRLSFFSVTKVSFEINYSSLYFFITLDLFSDFCCIERGTDHEAVVCEGTTLEINCKGQQIEIIGAEYGRTEKGSKYCPKFLLDLNTKCYSEESTLAISKEECDGYRSCTLYANNEEYGDPCLGTYKYLKVCLHATHSLIREFNRGSIIS